MAEIYTKLVFKMPTEYDYFVIKSFVEDCIDHANCWPIEKYDDKSFVIETKDEILATDNDAIDVSKAIEKTIKQIIDAAKEEKADERIINRLSSICYVMEGETEYTNTGETIRFRIERNKDGKTTIEDDI